MPIREKGYTHWDGEFQPKKFFWWPITRYGIKLTFKKKFFKFVFFHDACACCCLSRSNLCFRKIG